MARVVIENVDVSGRLNWTRPADGQGRRGEFWPLGHAAIQDSDVSGVWFAAAVIEPTRDAPPHLSVRPR